MAIDPRISLTPAPTINVGQRFGQALQNVQSLDNLQQNRRLAPLKEQQAQMNVDYQTQVQPMQVAAMQREQAKASNPLNIEAQKIQQLQTIGADYAQGLNQALATGNADNVQQYIQSKAQQYKDLPEVSQGITQDLQQLLTPTGMQELQAEVNTSLQGNQQQASRKSYAPLTLSDGSVGIPVYNPNDNTSELVTVQGATQLTPEQKQQAELRKGLLEQASKVSGDAFDQLRGNRQTITTMNEAIKAIDNNASSGFFSKYLPSFRESTIQLENAAQRMGLDVIAATTFGALSEGELRLAMDTAVPSNLKPKALKSWLNERITAKKKLSRELTKMAVELGKGKTTVAEYLEKNATMDERSELDILSDYGL